MFMNQSQEHMGRIGIGIGMAGAVWGIILSRSLCPNDLMEILRVQLKGVWRQDYAAS